MASGSKKNNNIFIGGSGASPAHGHCGLESLADAESKDYEALFINASDAMETVIAVLKMCENNRAVQATFVDPLRRLANACEEARGPLLQVRQIYIDSAKQSLAAGRPPSRSTVNLRHFALCTRDAAEHAASLYAGVTRSSGIFSICSCTPKVSPDAAGRQLDADRRRVKSYFRSLLIEQGIPVTSWERGGNK